MTKEFVLNEINNAHAEINQGMFDDAVEHLKMLKNRIHDESILSDITSFEKEYDEKLGERIKDITNGSSDQLRKQVDAATQWKNYAIAYLRFFSKLIHDHDFF